MTDIQTKYRIGIDVGGTFTHAVALDGLSYELLAKAKVLTTHEVGVAIGIIEVLDKLLKIANIKPDDVNFIAYSTTQATNALLEGDLAKVGILAMATSDLKFIINAITKFGKIQLDNHKHLETCHEFINIDNGIDENIVLSKLESLSNQGAQAIAITSAYGTDFSELEKCVLDIAVKNNYLSTSGTQVSQLYGLKARTMTAVINAAMLPKMLESANLTQESIKKANIKAPIMIMRSDGGVMDLEAMRQKPILTVLSGPASGVAAATIYLNISDGVFVEVGGTSSDISVIKNGQAQLRYAQIGGNKLYTKTIDIRTIGIGGGSMPRISNKKITHIGPRSAHIAGCHYASFYNGKVDNFKLELISPKANDPSDYLVFSNSENTKVALTTTCAANILGIVPVGDNAYSDSITIKTFIEMLSDYLKTDYLSIAKSILDIASIECLKIINSLIKLYTLDKNTLIIYGGGGGASAIVSYLAKKLNYNYQLAQNNDVISAIGVAIALLRDSFEKSAINPSNQEIIEYRQKIEKSH